MMRLTCACRSVRASSSGERSGVVGDELCQGEGGGRGGGGGVADVNGAGGGGEQEVVDEAPVAVDGLGADAGEGGLDWPSGPIAGT